MNVVFRADASMQIGSGHVMRCLTLADALRAGGAGCTFVCRAHPGNLADQIERRGHAVRMLDGGLGRPPESGPVPGAPTHASWLGVDALTDMRETAVVLRELEPDWLVVDHYALDEQWERPLRADCARLMVVDDLADRRHDCDLLVDQSLGRDPDDYRKLVPAGCQVMAGVRFAMLRPEFAAQRTRSLDRRKAGRLERLLVSMGGVDQVNATGAVLAALRSCQFEQPVAITVVMGPHAPWKEEVESLAARLPWPCEVRVGIDDMADVMAASDLAIGAAGSTSWERCCLGLPAILVVLAGNQEPIAAALANAGAARVISGVDDIGASLPRLISAMDSAELSRCSMAAAAICDGQGAGRVVEAMTGSGCLARELRESDLPLVLAWRNHEDVRRFMHTQHQIGEAEHRAWFERSATDPMRHLLLVEDHGSPIGFVQFHQVGDRVAEWGFYAAPDATPGTGRKLAAAALAHAFERLQLREIHGEVRAGNERSAAFHRRLGFREVSSGDTASGAGAMRHVERRFVLDATTWRKNNETSDQG